MNKEGKGGRPRSLTPDEELEVYKLYKEGISQVEIAYKYGISTTTIFRTAKRIEKQKRGRKKIEQ